MIGTGNSAVLLLLLASWSSLLQAQVISSGPGNAPAVPEAVTVIDNVRVVLVEEAWVTPLQSVVIEGSRIRLVATPLEFDAGPDAKRIDGGGNYLIPGLFDAHTHLISDPDTFAPLLVAHGVTAVRDVGGPTASVLGLKREAATRRTPCPDIVCTGAIIDGNPPVWPFSEPVGTADEARAAVRKLAAAGVDQIKVYSRLPAEAWRAAVDEAGKVGLKVTGHVPFSVSLGEAVSAGQSCIEHLEGFAPMFNGMTGAEPAPAGSSEMSAAFRGWSRWKDVDRDELGEHLKKHVAAGTFHCPTLIVMQSVGRIQDPDNDPDSDPRMKYVSPSVLSFWQSPNYGSFSPHAKAAVPAMIELVGEMHRAGIPLVVGTDLANPYVFAGSAVHDEMELMAKAGIPAPEILKMAALNSARLCGLEATHGSIEAGKTASMVLLRRNPMEDIAAVREIEAVFLRGRYFGRSTLDRQLNNVRLRVSRPAAGDVAVKEPDLPGKRILAGKYNLKFQSFPAGQERFVVTEAEDGWRVWAHLQPQGGGQQPALVTTHLDRAGRFAGGSYQLLAGEQTVASYRIEDGKFWGEATQAGRPLDPVGVQLPEKYVLSSPAFASEFNSFRFLELAVGESLETHSVGFGFPDWKPAVAEIRLERLPDETGNLGGFEGQIRRYRSSTQTETGEMQTDTWTDPDGHTLKTVIRFQFGSVTAERVLEENPPDGGGSP